SGHVPAGRLSPLPAAPGGQRPDRRGSARLGDGRACRAGVGRAGSSAGRRAYYERWAKTWEFQALLKARPAAGDAGLAAAYLASLTPLVWQAAQREGFVADVPAMRPRGIG